MPARADPLERFHAGYLVVGDCWVWQKGLSGGRYGKMKVNGRTVAAHRFSYEALVGPLPPGAYVLHSRECTTTACVNPDHLRPGTAQDNMDDAMALGHRFPQTGETNGQARLTREAVLAIRADPRIQRVVAAEYGISQQQVSDIRRRRRWAHV